MAYGDSSCVTMPRSALSVFIFLFLLISSSRADHRTEPKRECEASQMCSYGQVERWSGDITESANLLDMLKTVTYKREIIVTQLGGQSLEWAEQALQLWHELRSLGYGHFVVQAREGSTCRLLSKYALDLSCIWDSSPLQPHAFDDVTTVWHLHWRFMARVVRAGYNVMALDNDFIMFRDPYVHLKAPPMKHLQWICLSELGSINQCNGGFNYVQHAAPDGPVAWVLKHAAEIPLRWSDDGLAHLTSLGVQRPGATLCLTDEQVYLAIAFRSAYVGRPMQEPALRACWPEHWNATLPGGKVVTRDSALQLGEKLADPARFFTRGEVHPAHGWMPAVLEAGLHSQVYESYIANLTLPNLAYGYPLELGGPMFPATKGEYSAQFEAQLRGACPDCPWWREERPQEVQAVKQALTLDDINTLRHDAFWDKQHPRVERFGLAPAWFVTSMSGNRHGLWLGPAARVPTPWVSSHIHAWHLMEGGYNKVALRKIVGRYDWQLGSIMRRHAGRSPYISGTPVTRVLALSPALDLTRTRNWTEYNQLVSWLVQVALLTHRTPVLPDLPCETEWVHMRHVDDPARNASEVCRAPLMTGWRFQFPGQTPYAVDERGELVGGWTRSLPRVTRRLLLQEQAARTGPPQGDSGSGAAGQGASGCQATDGYSVGGSRQLSGMMEWLLGWRRGQEQQPVTDLDAWWRSQRFKVALSYVWDSACTQGLQALFAPEFHHWLTTSAAKGVTTLPSARNTAFVRGNGPGGEMLRLHPEPAPGGGALGPAAGGRVVASNEAGWSLVDTAVTLPVGQLLAEASRFESQPLLYLGHPVAATQKHPQANPQHAAALTHVERILQKSRCRALQIDPEATPGPTAPHVPLPAHKGEICRSNVVAAGSCAR